VDQTSKVSGLDARTGITRWTTDFSQPDGAPGDPAYIRGFAGGLAIVSQSGSFVGLDLDDGTRRWTVTTFGSASSGPELTGIPPESGQSDLQWWKFGAGAIVLVALIGCLVFVSRQPGRALTNVSTRLPE
jgi:hypothetical protein